MVPGGHAPSVVPMFIISPFPHNLHIPFWEGPGKVNCSSLVPIKLTEVKARVQSTEDTGVLGRETDTKPLPIDSSTEEGRQQRLNPKGN